MERNGLLANNKISERELEIVKTFEKNFWEILRMSDYKANQYVKDEQLIIDNNEIGNLATDMLDNIVIVSLNADLEGFLEKLEEEPYFKDNNLFIQWIRVCKEEREYASEDIKFFKNIEWDTLRTTIKHCFEYYVLTTNPYEKEFEGVSKEQLEIIAKVAFTLIEMIVVYNYSYDASKKRSWQMFVWEEKVFEVYWELIEKNRDMLWKNAVMQRILNLDKKVNAISNKIIKFDE